MRALQVDANDNVAVVVQDVLKGDEIKVTETLCITAQEDIKTGHKIAIADIPSEYVIKYGVPIGEASVEILTGYHVHTQNVADITEQLCKKYAEEFRQKAGEECGTDI